MTKHRDVNKCRQNEKCKRDAQIRQANKRASYERTNKPKIKKKNIWWKKRGKSTQNKLLSEKKEEAKEMSASNGTKAGYM